MSHDVRVACHMTSDLHVLCFFRAKRVKMLSQRESYGFHGFYFLWIFVYKYLVDTSFIFVSCTNLDGDYVSVAVHDAITAVEYYIYQRSSHTLLCGETF